MHCFEIFKSIPIDASKITSDVPPYEKNGSATPVTGTDDVTTAMFNAAWIPIRLVIPVARYEP